MQKITLLKMPEGQIIAVNDYEKAKKIICSEVKVIGTVNTELTAKELNDGIYLRYRNLLRVFLIIVDCLKEKNNPKNERKRVKKCRKQNQ